MKTSSSHSGNKPLVDTSESQFPLRNTHPTLSTASRAPLEGAREEEAGEAGAQAPRGREGVCPLMV